MTLFIIALYYRDAVIPMRYLRNKNNGVTSGYFGFL